MDGSRVSLCCCCCTCVVVFGVVMAGALVAVITFAVVAVAVTVVGVAAFVVATVTAGSTMCCAGIVVASDRDFMPKKIATPTIAKTPRPAAAYPSVAGRATVRVPTVVVVAGGVVTADGEGVT